MRIYKSKEPCALCGGHTWHCYNGEYVHGALDSVDDPSWLPVVDFYSTAEDGLYRFCFVDEWLTCGAVVS